MQKPKSSTHTVSSTNRPIAISSNFKFQKVEKLNQLVKNITETKVQTSNSQFQSKNTNPSEEKTLVSEKVLEKLKERIKTNYDQLYTNYSDNKTKILKQIQTVQTNIAGENHMNTKQEQVIKEKAKYDKLKARVEQMQHKFKKLNDLRLQLRIEGVNTTGVEVTEDYQQKLGDFEEKKQQIDHNNLVYQEMLKQRKAIELSLQERYTKISTELNRKKEKAEKLSLQNHKKKKMIMKLVEQIEKEEQIEIPTKLAEELSSKIQEYENKHSYNQIVQHETILQQKRFQNMKVESMKKRQEQRQTKLKKQHLQKNALEEMQTLYMIGNLEQEKLKKLCAAQSIDDVINSNLQLDKQSLENMSAQVEAEIQKLTEENKMIQTQISQLIAGEQEDIVPEESLEKLTIKLQEQTKKKKLLQHEYDKKNKLSNEWLTLMHLINGNRLTKEAQADFVKQLMNSHKKSVSEKSKLRTSSNLTEEVQKFEIK